MITLIAGTLQFYKNTSAEFYKAKASKNTFVAVFHSASCPHCRNFDKDYTAAANKLKGIVDLVAIECNEEQNKALCGQQEIKGFPTVKMFNHNGKKHAAIEYQGARTEQAVISWVAANHRKPFEHVESYAAAVKAVSELQDFVLVLTPQGKPASMVYQLARAFPKAKFVVQTGFKSEEKSGSEAFAKLVEQGVNVIVCRQKVDCVRYSGENSGDAIKTWLGSVLTK